MITAIISTRFRINLSVDQWLFLLCSSPPFSIENRLQQLRKPIPSLDQLGLDDITIRIVVAISQPDSKFCRVCFRVVPECLRNRNHAVGMIRGLAYGCRWSTVSPRSEIGL